MKEVQKIKGFKSNLTKIEGEISVLSDEIKRLQRELSKKHSVANSLTCKIINMKKSTSIKVSEPAMLRYFERIEGYNLDEIEEKIISDDLKNIVDTVGGNGSFPFGDHKIKMKNHTITTII
jgi:uncharacterized protein (UPF0335 family)